MKTSLCSFIVRITQAFRPPSGHRFRSVAKRGVALLLVASLVAGTVPARGDGMGMDVGMGGDYGGYDPGYGGGYDPIDWGGMGQLLDPIINPGYDPDPGPVEIPYEPYDPGYSPPTYNPG